MVDIEKLICDFLNPGELLGKEGKKRIEDKIRKTQRFDYTHFLIKEALEASLKKQGLEYKDGSLYYIGEEKKPSTIKFEETHGVDYHADGAIPKKDAEKLDKSSCTYEEGVTNEQQIYELNKSDSFWTDKEIEQLEKETDEGTDKIEKDLRKILFAKEPDFDKMVEEYSEKEKETTSGFFVITGSQVAQRAYRKGLEDMYHKLKGGKDE